MEALILGKVGLSGFCLYWFGFGLVGWQTIGPLDGNIGHLAFR